MSIRCLKTTNEAPAYPSFPGFCLVMRPKHHLALQSRWEQRPADGVRLARSLAIYGTEFSAAVVSDDGSSAIVNLGNAVTRNVWPPAEACLAAGTWPRWGIWFDLDRFLECIANVEWDDVRVAWMDRPAAQGAQGGRFPSR